LKEHLTHLHRCRGITWKRMDLILKQDPTLSNLFYYKPLDFSQLLSLPHDQSLKLFEDIHKLSFSTLMKTYRDSHIQITSSSESTYPYRLKQIFDPPFLIYSKGNPDLMSSAKMLSVVGARNGDLYGLNSIKRILPPLIEKGFVIVSGLAKGIDQWAHECTIRSNGATIGIIGGGLNHSYPSETKGLKAFMEQRHLVISEYPPMVRPEKWHFPMRNRLISGISSGTLVVQANQRSGSLITADAALEEGRDVFSIPGPIDSKLSEGTNKLIQQGAVLVQDAEDILKMISIY
jgi:DNA processing protein